MSITEEVSALVREVAQSAGLKEGDLLVIGCSTSAVQGELIGTHSSVDVGAQLWQGVWDTVRELKLKLAVQCCEHLNRALVTERSVMDKYGFEQVNAIPQPKAGGSFATQAYQHFEDPVLVGDIRQSALAGIDIGGVLIGMHVKPVVVPIKLKQDTVGKARIIAARYRPRFVGGSRAVYNEAIE